LLRRAFIVKASQARTAPDFSLRSIASTSGRLDVVLRSIISAFKTCDGIRENVDFYAILTGPPNPPVQLWISGMEKPEIPENEIELATIIKRLLAGETIKGYHISKASFEKTILSLMKQYYIFYLHENGEDIRKTHFKPGSYAFVLGDHVGLPLSDERFLEKLKVKKISLGPISYLTSQCITIVNNELDLLE